MTITSSPEQILLSELKDPLTGWLSHELRKTSVAVVHAASIEFGQWNLKPSEAALLKYVGANPGCTQSEIARTHRNKATNLVPLIARLERDGLLERIPGDRRAIALTLSVKGTRLLADVDGGFLRLQGWLSQNLTAKQQSAFIDTLRTVCEAACRYQKPNSGRPKSK